MAERPQKKGVLYIVATPIGNLGDMTERARQVLSQVAVIAAEDTRHTGRMLQHFGVDASLLSLHDYNEARRADDIVRRLAQGDDVALVSDAGTPLISDPGFAVAQAALAAGYQVAPIPGACAAIAALSASGMPTDRFVFEGFLPAKAGARRDRLSGLLSESRTLIFYEAPHRLSATLKDLVEQFGESRQAVVARELTKQYESFYRGALAELAERAARDADMARGEIVIVVAGAEVEGSSQSVDMTRLLRALLAELPASQAAKVAARATGEKRSVAYELALRLANKRP